MRSFIKGDGFFRFTGVLAYSTLLTWSPFAILRLYVGASALPYYLEAYYLALLLPLGIVFWLLLSKVFKVRKHIIDARLKDTKQLKVMGFFDVFYYELELFKKKKHWAFFVPLVAYVIMGGLFFVDILLLQAWNLFFDEFEGLFALRVVFNMLLIILAMLYLGLTFWVARPYKPPATD